MKRWIIGLTIALFSAGAGYADDWPCWLGPGGESVYRETGVIDAIPDEGLDVQWRVPVAWGYAGPSVADGKVFVSDFVKATGKLVNNAGARNALTGEERLLCFDAGTGHLLWKDGYQERYFISYAGGPRVTPTVDGDHVYTLGAEGKLVCRQTADGSVVWSHDLKAEYNTDSRYWGFSAAPLVDGDTLYCLVGGNGSVAVAFDKLTGEERWRALSAPTGGYCPPIMIETGGVKQLVVWHPKAINGLNPDTGDVYWSVELVPDFDMSITAPRLLGDRLFASGIGNVSALLTLAGDPPTAEVVWRGRGDKTVYCSNSTPFLEDGLIFGNGCMQGELAAVDLETGERLWETYEPTTGGRPQRHSTVFLIKHEDRFFLFNEKGELIVASLSRDGYDEHGRFQVLEPTNEAFGRPVVWSHPAFANRCVYARNDKELVCVSIAAE